MLFRLASPAVPFRSYIRARVALALSVLFVALLTWSGPIRPAVAVETEADFERGRNALQQGQFDTAIRQFDAAIKADPKHPKFFGYRGIAWLRQGKYREGIADLKKAIDLNPDDAGKNYSAYLSVRLGPFAREYGRRQVAEMLRDRPAMAEHFESTEFLRRWAMRRFAGEEFGQRIDWDPASPLHSDAEHLAPGYRQNAAILVEPLYTSGPNKGKPRSFEELWAGAIYELHNVSFATEFVRLHNEADEGKLSKEAFIAGIVRYELIAAQRTRAFYLQEYLPWAERQKQPTEPTLWFCNWWDNSKDILKGFVDRSAYPWRPYARAHDWATVHRYWRRGFVEKCRKLLDQMQAELGYDEDAADLAYWQGRCLARLGKTDDAMARFTEAIKLDPDDADSYRARGELYLSRGERAKAEADLNKARELDKN